MPSDTKLKIKKFSLFALDQKTAMPIKRMPFYAEVGVSSTVEPPPIVLDHRFDEAIHGALNLTDQHCQQNQQCSNNISGFLREGLSRHIAKEELDELAANSNFTIEFLIRIIKRVRDANGGASLLGLDINVLKPLFDTAFQIEPEESGLRLKPPPKLQPITWAHTGSLCT